MFISLTGVFSPKVRADDSLSVNIGLIEPCKSTVNNSGSATANVTAGNVNITIQNTDVMVGQTISGPGINGLVERNTRETTSTFTKNISVTEQTTITFTPIPTDYVNSGVNDVAPCPTGTTPLSSTLILNPIATSSPSPNANTTTPTTPTAQKPDNSIKSDNKKTDKKSTNVNLLPDEKSENTPEKKESSTVLVVAIISGTIIILGIIAYLIKIKKFKLRSFKDISRKSN